MKKPAAAGSNYKFDKYFYQIAHWPAKLFNSLYYHFRSREVRIKGTGLIFSNHTMAADPLLLGGAFPKHMYFVASEHVLRHPGSRLFLRLAHPIIRVKGISEPRCAMEILRQLKAGHSVCVFIEGERSWDGMTQPIPESAAHLAQMAGCPLYTYKIRGGYLSHPRWSTRLRRGKVRGELVNSYSPRELKGMTRSELIAAIRVDLFEDAYAEQGFKLTSYRGPKLAEHLETALFICPICGHLGTLFSQGNHFRCQCGLNVTYDEFGYFNGQNEADEVPFVTVRDWFDWQRLQVLQKTAEADVNGRWPLLADDYQSVYVMDGMEQRLLGKGLLSLWPDRLILDASQGESLEIPIDDLDDLACEEQMLLSFVHKGVIHEIRSAQPRAAIKYQLYFRTLKEARRSALAAQPVQ